MKLRGTPPISCEFCGEEIEAWGFADEYGLVIGGAHAYRWRHSKSGEDTCHLPRKARPYDGWDASRRIDATRDAAHRKADEL